MFRWQTRRAHYALLAAAHLLMTLPNLGAPTLWDMDEGVNAEAAREMVESGNWITPYFNYELRTAKPALLYWLQGTSFQVFGVNEFAARFPAVLCGLGTVLLTYEIARRMFAPSTGLLAGLVLASCLEFCLISHAATPDPPLLLFTTATLAVYWFGSTDGRRWWFVPAGALSALAVLTKGPIGVALPTAIIGLHLAWTGQLRKLLDWRLLQGALIFLLLAGAWYGFVALDTKGRWVREFFQKENLGRFSKPAENHGGGPWFHALALLGLFLPWSGFLVGGLIHGTRMTRRPSETDAVRSAYRFLATWFGVVLVVFSVAATKLPNYILPLYPAVAILTAVFLDRWRKGELSMPSWAMPTAAGFAVFVGIAVIVGLLFVGGVVPLPVTPKKFRAWPAMGRQAWIGVTLIVGGIAFLRLRRARPDTALTWFAGGAVAFLALASALAAPAMNDYKAPKAFAEVDGLRQTDREIRLASCRWLRESTVFYCRREVTRIDDFREVNTYLSLPVPCYLFIPEDEMKYLDEVRTVPVREVSRRYDFYARREIVVLANRYAE